MQKNNDIRVANTVRFFRTLMEEASLSRLEIEARTGLSWGSVSSISKELLEKGLIVAKKEEFTSGRPAERLSVNPDGPLCLGIDINSVGLSLNVVDLAGRSVFSEFLKTESRRAEALLSLLFDRVSGICERFPGLFSVNLSMQGTIDRERGISVRSGLFENWTQLPLKAMFEERFHIPTSLCHDPEALLTFHLHRDKRLSGLTQGAVIRIDEGIGMAELDGGQLYLPKSGASLELGHTVSVPGGLPCTCGKKGCLEAYSSLRGMELAYRAFGPDFPAAYRANDPKAREIVSRACYYLGLSLSNLFITRAPEFLLLDGIVPLLIPEFYDLTRENAEAFFGGPLPFFHAEYHRDAASIGACMFTVDRELERILTAG